MARDYSIWFIQGNTQMFLNSGSLMVHDGNGHALYRYSNGKLITISGNDTLLIRDDGFILNDTGNQMGFITDYSTFRKEMGKPGTKEKEPTTGIKPDAGTGGIKTGAGNKQTASASTQKKRRHGWILVLIIIGVIYLIAQNKGAGPVYNSISEAVVPLKEAILNHDDTATVRIRIRHPSNTLVLDEKEKLYEGIYKHTGKPNEGDQLFLCTGVSFQSDKDDDKGDIYTITATYSYYTTKEQEERLRKDISSTVKSLNLSGKTSYEKVRAIYNWICRHVTYDYARLNDDSYKLKYTAYNAMTKGTAVCSGYAQLFYRMALEAGLEARIVISYTHAYNVVRLGAKYYYCDPTWDAGNTESQYEFFLKGYRDFKDHGITEPNGYLSVYKNLLFLLDTTLPMSTNAYGK